MALTIDPEVLTALTPLMSDPPEPPAVGDVDGRRRNTRLFFEQVHAGRPIAPGVQGDAHSVRTADGGEIPAQWYHATGAEQPGSAVLYLHGGGMIYGLAHMGDAYDRTARGYVAASGVPMFVVDYRVAPEHPNPTPVQDCYDALCWLADNAAGLGVDPDRIAVMGDSAGGGLAAGVSLLARDRGGPRIAQQILVYPMLDDRTAAPDPAIAPFATWSYDDNVTGWGALLGSNPPTPYAAPARVDDLSNLPPTFIDVGDLDIFRAEDIEYAHRLVAAGVPTELHVYPGCPHVFEVLAPDAAVSRLALAARLRRLRML